MKRTRVTVSPESFPQPLRGLLQGTAVYDSSCSPEARVFYLERDGGYYLKKASKGTLQQEAELGRYFHQKGLSPAVLEYLSAEEDWLLTARAGGEDCTHAEYLKNPTRLCDLLAELLRKLHETDAGGCPVPHRTADYFATVDRRFAAGVFDVSYLPERLRHLSAREAWRIVDEARGALRQDVLLHGDYCLPNIMLQDWRFSAFIDLGSGGVGDRHIDLYWGIWTLQFNLGTAAYTDRFLDAYGRDGVQPELLDVIGAAECFG
ncbi:MAG: aminoglycoside 3'-phosphotransferase [Clostridia bacterium]|nr:aminoglycoside 3'-phosphotransferase [Clostridia bacterium]